MLQFHSEHTNVITVSQLGSFGEDQSISHKKIRKPKTVFGNEGEGKELPE